MRPQAATRDAISRKRPIGGLSFEGRFLPRLTVPARPLSPQYYFFFIALCYRPFAPLPLSAFLTRLPSRVTSQQQSTPLHLLSTGPRSSPRFQKAPCRHSRISVDGAA